MARIPTIISERLPDTTGSQVPTLAGQRRAAESYDPELQAALQKSRAMGLGGEVADYITDSLYKIEQKRKQTREYNMLANARLDSSSQYEALLDEMSSPEFRKNNYYDTWNDSYNKRSKEIQDKISQKYQGSKEFRDALNLVLKEGHLNYSTKINKLSRDSEFKEGQSDFSKRTDQYLNLAVDAGIRVDHKALLSILATAKGDITAAGKVGYITDSEQFFDTFSDTVHRAYYSEMMFRNPALAVKILNEPITETIIDSEGEERTEFILDEPVRIELLEQAQRKLDALEKKQEQVDKSGRYLLQEELKGYYADAAKNGRDLNRETGFQLRLDKLYPKTEDRELEQAQFEKNIDTSIKIFDGITPIKTIPESKLKTHVESLKPEQGSPTFLTDQMVYNSAVEASAERAKLIKADAFSYAEDNLKESGILEGKTVQDQLKLILQEQRRLEVPDEHIRFLSDKQISDFNYEIEEARPNEKIDLIKKYKEAYGNYWPQVYNDLVKVGKIPEYLQIVTSLDTEDSTQRKIAQNLAEGAMLTDDKFKQARPSTAGNDISIIDKIIDGEVSIGDMQFSMLAQNGSADTIEKVGNLKKAIKRAAMAEVIRSGKDPDKAAREVSNEIVKKHWNFWNLVRIPKEYDKKQIAAVGELIKQKLTQEGLSDIYKNKERVLEDVKREGYWINNSNKSMRLVHKSGIPVRTIGGEFIDLGFDQVSLYTVGQEEEEGAIKTENVLKSSSSAAARAQLEEQKMIEKAVKPGGTQRVSIDEIISKNAEKYNVDPKLIKAVIKQESDFDVKATSKKGAKGLMQLMPETAKDLGVKDAYDPEQNIEGGTKYLGQLLDMFDGNIELALAAYNAGPTNVKRYGNKVPPFKETQNYVAKIIKNYGVK